VLFITDDLLHDADQALSDLGLNLRRQAGPYLADGDRDQRTWRVGMHRQFVQWQRKLPMGWDLRWGR